MSEDLLTEVENEDLAMDFMKPDLGSLLRNTEALLAVILMSTSLRLELLVSVSERAVEIGGERLGVGRSL